MDTLIWCSKCGEKTIHFVEYPKNCTEDNVPISWRCQNCATKFTNGELNFNNEYTLKTKDNDKES